MRRGAPKRFPRISSGRSRLIGEPYAARARVEAFREAGADLPVIYPVATADDPIGSVARTLIAAVTV